jgi:integrase
LGKLGKYAVVRQGNKTIYLKDPQGRNARHGTKEALNAYNCYCAELQSNPTGYIPPTGEADVSVRELALSFLDHLKERTDEISYITYRIIIDEFLLELYSGTPADEFSTTCLDLVRGAMKQSKRFNRDVLNRHTRRIISIFKWGVWKELCKESTWQKLTVIPPYKKGEPGTFEGRKRKPVSDDVLIRTIKYAVPTEAAMIKVHRLTGARPGEICNLTVGALYLKEGKILLTEHKTKAHVGERTVDLRPEAREIIAPYLAGKKPEDAVFSPRQVMTERYAAKRAGRKTNLTPSQEERNRQKSEKPKSRVGEFYNPKSYYRMVERLIKRANKAGEKIPKWFPYMIRHATATADAMDSILKLAMERLGHTTPKMTENYAQVKSILENMLALTQDNPFAKTDD